MTILNFSTIFLISLSVSMTVIVLLMLIPVQASSIPNHVTINWSGKNCSSTANYGVVFWNGNETKTQLANCKGVLLSIDSNDQAGALAFLRIHHSNYLAVIFDDYSPVAFGSYYSSFAKIIQVIPVEYYPSWDNYTSRYSKSVIIPIGFSTYPDLAQNASTSQWNSTVVSYASQAEHLVNPATMQSFGFKNVYILVYEAPTSFQRNWSETYIDGSIQASDKFNGLVIWNA
jgi:hypothetical protein